MEQIIQRYAAQASTFSSLGSSLYDSNLSNNAVADEFHFLGGNGSAAGGAAVVPLGDDVTGASGGGGATYTLQRTLRNVITPAICVLGCAGNIINLVVLNHIRLRKADGTKDNGSHLGLIMLAVSDMLFCIAMFPRGFVAENESLFTRFDFWLVYQVYGTGVITTFIATSTWLTVIMAVLRYIGICHPFMARKIDGPFFAKRLYVGVFILCILLNVPSFFHYRISSIDLQGQVFHLVDIGYIDEGTYTGRTFNITKAIISIFFPMILLIFCNCSLIRTLQNSYRLRRQFHVQEPVSKTSNRITLTLIIIIIAFVILVIPCEVMDFFTDTIQLNTLRTELFLLLRSIGNICQIVNFSFNFVLYCSINVHFRSVVIDLFACNWKFLSGSSMIHNRRMTRNLSMRTSTTHLPTPPSSSQHFQLQRLGSAAISYR